MGTYATPELLAQNQDIPNSIASGLEVEVNTSANDSVTLKFDITPNSAATLTLAFKAEGASLLKIDNSGVAAADQVTVDLTTQSEFSIRLDTTGISTLTIIMAGDDDTADLVTLYAVADGSNNHSKNVTIINS